MEENIFSSKAKVFFLIKKSVHSNGILFLWQKKISVPLLLWEIVKRDKNIFSRSKSFVPYGACLQREENIFIESILSPSLTLFRETKNVKRVRSFSFPRVNPIQVFVVYHHRKFHGRRFRSLLVNRSTWGSLDLFTVFKAASKSQLDAKTESGSFSFLPLFLTWLGLAWVAFAFWDFVKV